MHETDSQISSLQVRRCQTYSIRILSNQLLTSTSWTQISRMESIGMVPNGNARQGLDGRTPYGQRLLPQIIDSSAADDPARLVGMIAKSTDISQGFTKVTIGEAALAVNYMAWWIEEHVGSSKDFETVAYLVNLSKFEASLNNS